MRTPANKTELNSGSSGFLHTGGLLVYYPRQLVILPVLNEGDLFLVQLADLLRLFPVFLPPGPAVLIHLSDGLGGGGLGSQIGPLAHHTQASAGTFRVKK